MVKEIIIRNEYIPSKAHIIITTTTNNNNGRHIIQLAGIYEADNLKLCIIVKDSFLII